MFSIGSVSEGTLRTEDLLPCFADELLAAINRLDTVTGSTDAAALARLKQLSKLHDEAEHIAYCLSEGWLNEEGQEAASEILGELMDALTDLAPPFVHFGGHEGDGACFGYWPAIDALEEAARDGEVLKLPAGDAHPEGFAGLIMEVTDHGNVTLYSVSQTPYKCTELWACV